jgi:hypothetical protein
MTAYPRCDGAAAAGRGPQAYTGAVTVEWRTDDGDATEARVCLYRKGNRRGGRLRARCSAMDTTTMARVASRRSRVVASTFVSATRRVGASSLRLIGA